MRARKIARALAAFVRDAARAPMPPGRSPTPADDRLRDLRISVTDRCNFRCVYCMPKDVFGRDYPFLPHDELLTFEEITRVARVFVGLGVRKIRLTGGEPLLRRKLERLVEMLRGIGDDLDITLTTNGALLARKARDLRAAGLVARHREPRLARRRDVSRDERRRLSGRASVLEGIDAAAAAGLAPLKINMVVKRGMNEGSIVPMARRFQRQRPHRALHRVHGRRRHQRLAHGRRGAGARDRARRSAREMPLKPADPNYRGEVAERWAYADGGGEIGVIASVTQAFCRDCTRARCRPKASSTPASSPARASTCASCCAAAATTRRCSARWPRSGASAATAIRRSARPSTARARKVEMSYIGGLSA